MPFEGMLWAMGGQMFQVIVESPMSPRVSDLKAPELQWQRNYNKPKILFNNYCKEIMLWNIR
jgi:hypothetical protein